MGLFLKSNGFVPEVAVGVRRAAVAVPVVTRKKPAEKKDD
jgi:hypothetical protein